MPVLSSVNCSALLRFSPPLTFNKLSLSHASVFSLPVLIYCFSLFPCRLLYGAQENKKVADALLFLEGTVFGNEIFQLPKGKQARLMPTILKKARKKLAEEAVARKNASLESFMTSEGASSSPAVPRNFSPLIFNLMEPFVLYFSGISTSLASQSVLLILTFFQLTNLTEACPKVLIFIGAVPSRDCWRFRPKIKQAL